VRTPHQIQAKPPKSRKFSPVEAGPFEAAFVPVKPWQRDFAALGLSKEMNSRELIDWFKILASC